ncbi:crossover junction endodeoxyribonuclease RuvC [Suttonella sp. R2A3]|uniref:crossover junction endodeoxyribonuclease RuvC n=1 Tax=Suttonella sp. R2A3 TaxID=2908648 RepID=UPI001F1612AC|nr:crossover junction endodeoxyribonuclease RuvC [Suttonella sp. R2A3]UJF24477.1 crossover junction endodeoxyribonuclease RuvC [Suttonella sp. R2A3]
MNNTRRILGIDPGSQITGYGIVDLCGNTVRYIDSGCVRLAKEEMPVRLMMIHQAIGELVAQYQPQEFAIESIFVHKNPNSALKLGQARGVAICAAVLAELPVSEYAAKSIKQAVVGQGGADKLQVQHMVKILLNCSGAIQSDAADALAVALTHAHHLQTQHRRQRGGVSSAWEG